MRNDIRSPFRNFFIGEMVTEISTFCLISHFRLISTFCPFIYFVFTVNNEQWNVQFFIVSSKCSPPFLEICFLQECIGVTFAVSLFIYVFIRSQSFLFLRTFFVFKKALQKSDWIWRWWWWWWWWSTLFMCRCILFH